MSSMRFSIRLKFLGIILIATILPLIIGMISLRILGNRIFTSQKGDLFSTMSLQIAARLEQSIEERIENLDLWLSYTPFDLLSETMVQGELTPEERISVEEMEAVWPDLGSDSPVLRRFLANPVADQLASFQERFPLFVEIFVTDRQGRLVAATNKTSDYFQADEAWWQETIGLPPGGSWLDGVHLDASANVMSLDISLPVFLRREGRLETAGAVKAVLSIRPFFDSLPPVFTDTRPASHVVLENGTVLTGLFGSGIDIPGDRLDAETTSAIRRKRRGWFVRSAFSPQKEIVGVSPLVIGGHSTAPSENRISPMYVVVHSSVEEVLAPVRRQLWMLLVSGGLMVLGFAGVALYIARQKILRPIKTLQRAVRSIAERASPEAQTLDPASDSARQAAARESILDVERVQTRDEFEDLAQGFGLMARRVLDYHEQLEREIEVRTKEVEKDLRMARDFQQTLLPRNYPKIPSESGTSPIELAFHHVYKPSLSVSGDFFDVFAVSDHEAGIFLADVMGHGARAALIVAILRTMMQNFRHDRHADSPSEVLSLINKQLADLLPHEGTKIFATAVFLIVDAREKKIRYWLAGHPSPIRIDRTAGTVEPLIPLDHNNIALGLMHDFVFKGYEVPFGENDILLLYTDGAIESPNPRGEQFGEERLLDVIRLNMSRPASEIDEAVMAALHRFMDTVVTPDDICLVTVEALPAQQASNSSQA